MSVEKVTSSPTNTPAARGEYHHGTRLTSSEATGTAASSVDSWTKSLRVVPFQRERVRKRARTAANMAPKRMKNGPESERTVWERTSLPTSSRTFSSPEPFGVETIVDPMAAAASEEPGAAQSRSVGMRSVIWTYPRWRVASELAVRGGPPARVMPRATRGPAAAK